VLRVCGNALGDAVTFRVLSLFAGIGGFDLGLERTGGFRTVAFCEIEPFAQRVLSKNWPGIPVYDDVRQLTAGRLAADGIVPNVIVGGFPCQDISLAGKGAGLAGERSGLWSEYARLIGELRPLYVIVENVAALLSRGLGDVLGDLAALGYDAEWHCIPASAVGAPHRRDRIWILAHPQLQQQRQNALQNGRGLGVAGEAPGERGEGSGEATGRSGVLADAASERRRKAGEHQPKRHEERAPSGCSAVPYADAINAQGFVGRRNDTIIRREQIERQARLCSGAGEHQDWSVEPAVGRVAHGVPDRVGQLRAYGNAVVPQIPELIGRAILDAGAA
jgi:DNA (cytosine-5)-methyltransferase 1